MSILQEEMPEISKKKTDTEDEEEAPEITGELSQDPNFDLFDTIFD